MEKPGVEILGVGTGEALDAANLGATWPNPPERYRRLDKAMGLIRRLWSKDRMTLDGTCYRAHDVTIDPDPVGHIDR